MSKRSIWKFPIELQGKTSLDATVLMPQGAAILSVAMQGPTLCLWAVVSPSAPKEERRIRVLATGEEFEMGPEHRFIGTVADSHRSLILLMWHVFEVVAQKPSDKKLPTTVDEVLETLEAAVGYGAYGTKG